MRCKIQGMNDFGDSHVEEYYETREEEFSAYILNLVERYCGENDGDVNILDLHAFSEWAADNSKSDFTFKDEGEWLEEQFLDEISACGDKADRLRDEEAERQWEA